MVLQLWKEICEFLLKLIIYEIHTANTLSPSNSFAVFLPMRNESIYLQKDCTGMFLAVSFVVVPKLQTLHMPFHRRMDKETWNIHITGFLLSIVSYNQEKLLKYETT